MLTTPAPSSGDDMPIDVDLIKVLASDTRRDMLRLLGERRHTLSELAEALNLKKATILEHLEKLVAADLIRKLDDGERIWIYYELTRRGNRLVHPQRTTRFYLLMAASVAAVVILGAIVAATMVGNNASQDFATSPESAADGTLANDLRASAPLVVYRGFDDGVPILLESVAPPGSTLLVNGREFVVSDGQAILSAEDVDALPEGRLALSLRTDAGILPLRSELDVRTPPVALAPLAITEDATSQILLSVGAPGLPSPTNLTVLVDGAPIEIGSNGRESFFALTPTDAGVIDVRIGRLIQRDVRVLADMQAIATNDNGTLALDVSDSSGPIEGVRVLLDREALGVTNATGTLRALWPAPGERALELVAPDRRSVELAVLVGESAFQEMPARFTLSAYSDPGVQTLAALVDVTNGGVANDTVTLVARLDGTAIASARLDVAAGSRGETRLVANVPLTAPITIEAYGTRSSFAFSSRSFDGDSTLASGASAPTSPTPAAMPMASEGSNASVRYEATQVDEYAMKSTIAGRAPDATLTLYPMFAPTGAVAKDASAADAPAVPFVSPALMLAAIAALALLTRRGARDRR